MPENEKSCPICTEDYDAYERQPRALPCGHVFCNSCLMTLEENTDRDCPDCRKSWANTPRSHLPVIFCPMEDTCSKQDQMTLELAKLILKYGVSAIKSGFQTFDGMLVKGISNAGLLFDKDPNQEKEIYVKDIRGKTITLRMSLSDSVDSLRRVLQQHLGIAPDQQLLLYNGRPLQDGRKLTDYNVQGYSTIQAVCRQLGG